MSDEAADSVILSQPKRQKIFAYLGILIVLLAFGAPSGGLIDIPISFLLKNKLHLQASELANFRLVAALPLYSSCIFGFDEPLTVVIAGSKFCVWDELISPPIRINGHDLRRQRVERHIARNASADRNREIDVGYRRNVLFPDHRGDPGALFA
jgi:hypothetical protein